MNLFLENWDYNDTSFQRFWITGAETPKVISGGRRGTSCCAADTEDGYGGYLVAGSGNTLICGAAVAFPTASGFGHIFGIGDPTASGMVNIYISALDDGSLAVYRSPNTILALSPAGVLALGGAYNYVEAKVGIASGTSGSVEVRINGEPIITLNATNTFRAGSLTPNLLFIYPQGRRRYDDLYINTGLGLYNNDFEGDVRIDTHMPNANGNSSQWNRSAGTLQFETIDERPPDEDVSYNFADTAGDKDTLGIQALIPVFAGIRSVALLHRMRPESGTIDITPIVRSQSVDHQGTAFTIASGYEYYQTIYETDPATDAPWTDEGFDAAEWGYEKS
jgi:hypothetical protein